jgi:type II secretory pathway component GspD/PulD (secretin)
LAILACFPAFPSRFALVWSGKTGDNQLGQGRGFRRISRERTVSMSPIRVLLCLGILVALAAPALAVPTDPPPKQDTPFEKIRKALDGNISVDFQQVPLSSAIENVQSQMKVNIVIDRGTINNIGVLPEEMMVTLKLKDAKARTVLRMVLAQANLSYYVEQDVVVVTHEEIANQRQVRQRVDVDVENQTLAKALADLQRQTGTNLVIDPRYAKKATDPVTLRLENVPLEVAVRLLAEMAGLRSVKQSNIIFITNKETAGELKKEEEIKNPYNNPFFPMPFQGGIGGLPLMKGIGVPMVDPAVPPAIPDPNELPVNPPMALPPPNVLPGPPMP